METTLVFRVWGLGLRVSGLGLRVSVLGFGVQGCGFRVMGLGRFKVVEGLGLRVPNPVIRRFPGPAAPVNLRDIYHKSRGQKPRKVDSSWAQVGH